MRIDLLESAYHKNVERIDLLERVLRKLIAKCAHWVPPHEAYLWADLIEELDGIPRSDV